MMGLAVVMTIVAIILIFVAKEGWSKVRQGSSYINIYSFSIKESSCEGTFSLYINFKKL